MHAQAEGVPFIVEEMAFAYREGGMVQEIDGVWTLAGNAERLVPSAVKTLISRRATKLPDDTKALLAVAAILGRRFSLKDLREVQLGVDGAAPDPEELAETLTPAVTAGLLDRARGGLGRRLQLPARAGPRVRGRDAHVGRAPRDPRGDRGAADVRRALGRAACR